MSERHPIIAATGSSGAGTTTVLRAFSRIFERLNTNVAVVEGDGFHLYNRDQMRDALQKARIRSENFSHFGPAANHFDRLESLFRQYAKSGAGEYRNYVHNEDEAALFNVPAGHFTDWTQVPEDTDLLFYEGLHGGVVTEENNIAQYADLLIGIVPTMNLEWTQKIQRDTQDRGYSHDAVKQNILLRMYDYVNYITPQFSRTDVNFQRVPTVDTSNPFTVSEVPTQDESFVVIRFRDPRKLKVDFPYLLSMIHQSFMSRADTLVVPGGKMEIAIEVIFTPIVEELLSKRQAANWRAALSDR